MADTKEVSTLPEPIKLPSGIGTVQETGCGVIRFEAESPEAFRAVGGSETFQFNDVLLRTVQQTLGSAGTGQKAAQFAAAVAALNAFKPADEIEGMLAAQAVAMHYSSLECFRRAVLPNQPPDLASKLRRDGANMARGMTDMIEALDRKRGKGAQVVRVERVVVHEGGQAVVGNVHGGGRGV